ncbi:Uncharacterised protein [Citrobacter freundii]|nr:Uncharacterised protein [Citrobacter freundii]
MANVNKIIRRRQVALLIALILGIGAGGVGTWMVSEMNLKKAPPAQSPERGTRAGHDRRGEPVL